MKTCFLLFCLFPVLLGASAIPPSTPHGILVDRVVPLAHLEELDGSSAAPATSLARWRQTMHELERSAEAGRLDWPQPRALQVAAVAGAADSEVPLAVIQARYDRLDDANGTTPGQVFALGVLRETVYRGAELGFRLESARIFTHGAAGLREFTLDADDGQGPRPLPVGEDFRVSYATTGRKTLTLTTLTPGGDTLTARALLTVEALVTPDPTMTWAITATEPFAGAVGSGQAYLYLAPGHATLTNPVIVVEGFDLDNSMDWPVLYDALNQQNLLEDLRSAGFDAVVLDFTEATDPIERNAFVLAALLAQVNATIPAGKTSVVIGASMGGLVARYGLAWLEQQGVDHRVRTYLSFDSPHTGANIPLGVQHWLRFFRDESTDADFLLSRLDTPAARQMLIYHFSATSSNSAASAPERAAWLADMASVGDWPLMPRKVAIANGSGTGQDQGFSATDQLIRYEYRSLLIDIDGNVWPVPASGDPQVVFDGMINLLWPLPDTYETISVSGTQPWDNAPGGYRDSMAQMDATSPSYGDIIALYDNHCFVPTVSALALTGAGPFQAVAADPDLLAKTEFDQVYWPVANQGHIAITAENKAWFMAEIEAGISGVETLPTADLVTLYPAVPNPFNPRTEIRFRLAERAAVSLEIYDLAGRLVRRLTDREVLSSGLHTAVWNGMDEAGLSQASGLYLSRLQVADETRTGRLVLVR